MCTTDCYCYEGDDGSVKNKWNAVGEEVFN